MGLTLQTRTRDRHERILDAALDVFATRGFAAASVDDVALAADTSKGGLYFHFPGKDALFIALLDRSVHLLLGRVGDSVAREPDPTRRVDAALRALFDALTAHRRLARLLVVEAFGAGPRFHERMLRAQAEFATFIQRQLDEAVAIGTIPRLDSALAGQIWFGALNQVVIAWALAESPSPLESKYPELRALLLRSVGLTP